MKFCKFCKHLHVVAVLIFFISFAAVGFSSEPTIDDIEFLTEEYPPFNFKSNGVLQGISVDLLDISLKRIGSSTTKADIVLLPWARGYRDVLTKENTCLFGMTRTKEREKKFKWVGPFAKNRIVLLAPKYKHIKIDSMSGVNKYIVGVVREDVGEQLLVDNGIAKGALSIVSHPDLNAKKISAGIIDIWAYDEIVAKWLLREKGYNPEDYEVVLVLAESGLYFAFNIHTPDALVDKLQWALDEVKVEDEYQEILDRYLN